MPKIFVSWRHDSSTADRVAHLCDRLQQTFGRDAVALDLYQEGGDLPFPVWIADQLKACDVFLCIVAPGWIEGEDPETPGRWRRLMDPEDHVRKEIEAAYARPVPVMAVLIPPAKPPSRDVLPESIAGIADLVPFKVREAPDFDSDVERLVTRLKQIDHRIERARVESERLEKERREKEAREKEEAESERRLAESLEKQRMEDERREKKRLDDRRRETEHAEADKLERERIQNEREKANRVETDRREKQRLEAVHRRAEVAARLRLLAKQSVPWMIATAATAVAIALTITRPDIAPQLTDPDDPKHSEVPTVSEPATIVSEKPTRSRSKAVTSAATPPAAAGAVPTNFIVAPAEVREPEEPKRAPAAKGDRAAVEQALTTLKTEKRSYNAELTSENLPGVWNQLHSELAGREVTVLLEMLASPTSDQTTRWKVVALLRISQRTVDDPALLKSILATLCKHAIGGDEAVHLEALEAVREAPLPPEARVEALVPTLSRGNRLSSIATLIAQLAPAIDDVRTLEKAVRATLAPLPNASDADVGGLIEALTSMAMAARSVRKEIGAAIVRTAQTRNSSTGAKAGDALEKLDFRDAIPAIRTLLKTADTYGAVWQSKLLATWADREAAPLIRKALDRIRYVGDYSVSSLVKSVFSLEGDKSLPYLADVLRTEPPKLQKYLLNEALKTVRGPQLVTVVTRIRDTTTDADLKKAAETYLAGG